MLTNSILYCLFALFFFCILLFAKKDNTSDHSAAAWIVIHSGVLMWINNMIAGIYALVSIPFTLLSVSVAYFFLSMLGIIYIRKNGIQKYKWCIWDFLFMLFIIGVALSVGIRFHTKKLLICDVTGDSCMHFHYALNVSNHGIVKGEMFFAPVNNGLFISIVKPLVKPYQYYKAFFAMGIMMLALSGCAFYAIISDTMKGLLSRVFGLIVSLLYMLGYPLHNHLMGFCYLGMSITIIALLIFFVKLYLDNVMHNNWAICLMMLGCFSLVMCYMLFAPVIYIALFISLAIGSYKKTSMRCFIKTVLEIFLIPCVLGIYYCYFCFFKGRGLSIGDAITNNGGTRGHFYSHLLILFPATVYYLVTDIKKKQHLELTVFLLCVALFAALFLLLVYTDNISIYYYSKVPYLLWLMMSFSSFYGLKYMLDTDKNAFVSYTMVICFLFFVWVFNINGRLACKANEMGYGLFSEFYRTVSFGIYDDNINLIAGFGPYDLYKVNIFRYITENLKDETVPVLGDFTNYLDVYWCEDFTGKDLSDYYYWTSGIETVVEKIATDKETNYVVLLYNTSAYNDYNTIWQKFDTVFENTAGCILKIV